MKPVTNAELLAQLERNQSPTAEGAPWKVRMAVGAAQTPPDRLATLQQFYQDARPHGNDNFVYTDETGQTRLFNPQGLDWGDIPGAGPEIAEFAGGTLGAVAGGLAGIPGGPPGVFAGGVGGAGIGGAAMRDAYTAGQATLGSTIDTRSVPQQAVDTSQAAAWNMAGEGLGRAGGAAVSDLARRMVTTPGAAGRAAQFAQAGVDPRGAPGEIAGGKAFGNVTANADKMWGGGPMQAARENTMRSFENRVDDISTAVGGGRGLDPNEALRTGQTAASDTFRSNQKQLQDAMFAGAADVRVTPEDMSESRALLSQWKQAARESPNTAQHLESAIAELDGYVEDATRGGIPFKMMRERLTHITQSLASPQAGTEYIGKAGQARKKMEQALRADTRQAVGNQAPAAAQAVEEHDGYVRQFVAEEGPTGKTNAELLGQMDKRETDGLVTWAKSGSKSGAARLQQLQGLLPPEQWDQFRAAYLARMGRNPKSGEFSPTRFRGAFNELTGEAQQALFGREYSAVADLSEVGELVAGVEQLVNRSNTAITGANIGLGTVGAGTGYNAITSGEPLAALGAAAAMAAPAANYGISKAVTSPKFAQWAGGTLPPSAMTEAVKGGAGRTGVQFAPDADLMGTARADEFTPEAVAGAALDEAIGMAGQAGAQFLQRELQAAKVNPGRMKSAMQSVEQAAARARQGGDPDLARYLEDLAKRLDLTRLSPRDRGDSDSARDRAAKKATDYLNKDDITGGRPE